MQTERIEERLGALEARLEKVQSIQAALGVLRGYVDAVDAMNLDALAQVFTNDAVVEIPDAKATFTGIHDVMQNFFKNAWIQDPTVKRHFIMNSMPEWVSPGVVRVPSYFIFMSSGPDQSMLGWGTYLDEIRITDGVGQFQRKQIIVTKNSDIRTGWPLEQFN
jgi:hypothetical protein